MPWQFSLASLFLITTLAAVGVGIFMVAPGIGVLFAALTIPALVRTVVASMQQRQAGAPLTIGEKAGVFMMSCCIMVGIGFAVSIAFGVVCYGGAFVGSEIFQSRFAGTLALGIGAGLLAAVPLAIRLLYLTRPSNVEFEKRPAAGSRI